MNLALRVYGRRPDGYHEIDTLFQAIDLCDEVEVELGGEGVVVEVEGADLGAPEDNLAYRAAVRFAEAAGSEQGIRVKLAKRIPHGAGLGGGSSDAAAVLRCLSALIGGVDAQGLHAIGAELGSDVPFFLGDSPLARGRGRGEVLDELTPLPAADLVLLSPPVHVATAEAYRALAGSRGGEWTAGDRPGLVSLGTWEELQTVAENDFEPVIAGSHAEIGRALEALRSEGGRTVLMTGSGSTCFGVFPDTAAATAAAAALGADLGWPSSAVRTLDRLPDVRRV